MTWNYRQHKKICKKLAAIYQHDKYYITELDMIPHDEITEDDSQLVHGWYSFDSQYGDYSIFTIADHFDSLFFYSDKFLTADGHYLHNKRKKKRYNFMHIIQWARKNIDQVKFS